MGDSPRLQQFQSKLDKLKERAQRSRKLKLQIKKIIEESGFEVQPDYLGNLQMHTIKGQEIKGMKEKRREKRIEALLLSVLCHAARLSC